MFIKGRRPTSEKNFRPTASCIFRPGTFWENDLTKKTIIKTKTMKMTYSFREYLQRANLETLTFYKDKDRDKDIWITLRCILNPFLPSSSSSSILLLGSMYFWSWFIPLNRSCKYNENIARTGISTLNSHISKTVNFFEN